MWIIILGLLFVGCTANQSINRTKHIEAINQLYRNFELAYDSLDVAIVGDLYTQDAH